jgi:hypothetical protein
MKRVQTRRVPEDRENISLTKIHLIIVLEIDLFTSFSLPVYQFDTNQTQF